MLISYKCRLTVIQTTGNKIIWEFVSVLEQALDEVPMVYSVAKLY